MEGHPNTDSGAAIRDGIKSVNTTGVCHESQWPYDISTFTEKPPRACYQAAMHSRSLKYQRVRQEEEAIKHALVQQQTGVVFGFTVYESFESEEVKQTGVMPMPQPHERVLGGHAVMCVGYDDSKHAFIVRNSWGAEWGVGGYFYMPYEFMLNADSASDFWIIESISRAPAPKGSAAYEAMFPALPTADAVPPSPPREKDEAAGGEKEAQSKAVAPTSLRITGALAVSGSAQFKAGQDADITWETTGEVPNVKLLVCVNSWSGMLGSWTTIVEHTGNSGKYCWNIPCDAALDGRYWIRLLSCEDSSVVADSEYFAVVAAE